MITNTNINNIPGYCTFKDPILQKSCGKQMLQYLWMVSGWKKLVCSALEIKAPNLNPASCIFYVLMVSSNQDSVNKIWFYLRCYTKNPIIKWKQYDSRIVLNSTYRGILLCIFSFKLHSLKDSFLYHICWYKKQLLTWFNPIKWKLYLNIFLVSMTERARHDKLPKAASHINLMVILSENCYICMDSY